MYAFYRPLAKMFQYAANVVAVKNATIYTTLQRIGGGYCGEQRGSSKQITKVWQDMVVGKTAPIPLVGKV